MLSIFPSHGMHSQAHRACFAFTDLRTQHWSKKKKSLGQERLKCFEMDCRTAKAVKVRPRCP
jgi:hypothetical protein